LDGVLIPTARRCAVVLAAGAAALLGVAGPAAAHVEVDAAPARELATDALLTLDAEAESRSAGVTGVQILLPAGLLPAGLRLASGPPGWRLAGSGQVVTVRGPALPVGRNLQLRLRVRQLPAVDQLVLKTVQTYADGRQDSWIEVPSESVPEPEWPAPVLRLSAAAPGATPLPRSSGAAPTGAVRTAAPATAPSPTAPPTAAASTSAAPAAGSDQDGAGSAGWLFGGVAVGLLMLGGVVLAARRSGPPAAR